LLADDGRLLRHRAALRLGRHQQVERLRGHQLVGLARNATAFLVECALWLELREARDATFHLLGADIYGLHLPTSFSTATGSPATAGPWGPATTAPRGHLRKTVARAGNATTAAATSSITTANGSAPMNTSFSVMLLSSSADLTMKTAMPKGGVSKPISTTI